MPYKVERRGEKYAIINKQTGKVVGRSDTRAKAESSARARVSGEHGWRGTKRK